MGNLLKIAQKRRLAILNEVPDIMHLSYAASTEINLLVQTASGDDWEIDWGDGIWEQYASSSTIRTKTFSSSTSGVARVRSATGRRLSDISRFQSTGSTAWGFDLSVFIPLTGLTLFYLTDLPNSIITGSLNSFSGATGLTVFNLTNLPIAVITGDSLAFANKTNLRDFLIYTSPTSNIVMNYDDILNIWQSSVYIRHWGPGISSSKATTSPFNFDSLRAGANIINLRDIGLSTQSMDNMIIALDNSLIVQSSPKTIRIEQNAPHSGSPAVMTALSNLANKNVTVVL